MSTRTIQKSVRFHSDFFLRGFSARQPAGDYIVELDEELNDDFSGNGNKVVAAFIRLPMVEGSRTGWQVVQVDPAEINAALARDREQDG